MFWNRNQNNRKLFSDTSYEQQHMIGDRLNFASAEAYKLLRTNLMFSFTDEDKCRIVGITSSLKGEGKSLTAINLAYTIAETGKRVLLMECDMRLPTIAKRLGIESTIGLSNLLVGMNSAPTVPGCRGCLRGRLCLTYSNWAPRRRCGSPRGFRFHR